MRGLEPPRVAPHDPKSCASASSATSALFFNDLKEKLKIGITFGQFFHYFRVIISVQKHTTLLEVLNATILQMFKTFCPPTKQNCVISSNVKIGIMAYINFQCGIGHDSLIVDFVQINPGSQLGGFTHVGNRTLIGSGSTILQRVNIGTDVTVASGSVVFAKVVDNPTMVNSARRMRAFEKK